MNRFDYFLLLLYTSLISCKDTLAQESENCLTPRKIRGKCLNIRECQPLLQLLQSQRPLPPSVANYLRNSLCGFDGNDPIVCCPSPATSVQQETPAPSTNTEAPKDVSSHSNLKYLLPEICGPIYQDKIVNGNISGLFEFPWMALIAYNTRNGLQFRCGGSLINEQYILTAAHCITNLPGIELAGVRLGEYDINREEDCEKEVGCAPPVQDFTIQEAIPHPNFSKDNLQNDIGLIRIHGQADFTSRVRPICLPIGRSQQSMTMVGKKVTVAGWGATERGTASPVLMKVQLPVVPLNQCASIYNRTVPITEKQLCAGGSGGTDSCEGDSGGPLKFMGQAASGGLSYIQFGIVSFGPRRCGTEGRPGVYTRVGYYMDWILNTIRP